MPERCWALEVNRIAGFPKRHFLAAKVLIRGLSGNNTELCMGHSFANTKKSLRVFAIGVGKGLKLQAQLEEFTRRGVHSPAVATVG